MPIQNSKKIPAGSAFNQRESWVPLGKFRTLVCSIEFFETCGHGILPFTRAICKENSDQACLNKDLVNALYTIEVMDAYGGPGGPKATKLLSQLNCPLIQRFWESRSTAFKGHKRSANHLDAEYYWGRDPPRLEHATDGGVVLTNGIDHVLVPKIGLIPLLSLDLAEVERDIRAVNMMPIEEECMRRIKRGILISMYHASEPDAPRFTELMDACKTKVPLDEQPAATDDRAGHIETGQDQDTRKRSETSIFTHLSRRSGDENHRRRRAKGHSSAIIDHSSEYQVSISTTGSGTLEAGIRRAEVDTYGGTMSSLALRTKDTDSVKKAN